MSRALTVLAGIIGAVLYFAVCHGLAVGIDAYLHRMGL